MDSEVLFRNKCLDAVAMQTMLLQYPKKKRASGEVQTAHSGKDREVVVRIIVIKL